MVTAVILVVGVMMSSAGPISAFVNRHPTVKVLALFVFAADWHLAGQRGARFPHTERLSLLCDGLLRVCGNDHPASKENGSAGPPA